MRCQRAPTPGFSTTSSRSTRYLKDTQVNGAASVVTTRGQSGAWHSGSELTSFTRTKFISAPATSEIGRTTTRARRSDSEFRTDISSSTSRVHSADSRHDAGQPPDLPLAQISLLKYLYILLVAAPVAIIARFSSALHRFSSSRSARWRSSRSRPFSAPRPNPLRSVRRPRSEDCSARRWGISPSSSSRGSLSGRGSSSW